MKLTRVPALAGCFAMALTVSATWAQTPRTPTTGAGQTSGSTPGQTTGTSAGQTSGSAGGAGGQMQGDTMGNSPAGSDKKFVKEAMEGSMAEIQLGQLAQQKATSPDVKQFGQRMVTDHQKLNDQMTPVASQLGITPPAEPDMKQKAMQKKLQAMSGDEFDKAYMKAMVKDHKKDLAEFQKEASSGKNPQVKDAAQQGSQVIQQHLQMAQDVAQKVGAGGGKGSKSGIGRNGDTGAGTSDNKEHQ
ncbi:DUF4142 domain-containing protein [Occallatibacter riparius]|uniref:DUF4142 domain-containing protein n=1 Tax=Occallatibacter riparius TaxID=1002689 RepID=A0A9J7BV98_9BACT|nr:DUF4142 domain-containing protein [Occallatibacter riparius]UWZ86544.1 DUF4142 domain-containing protein [Occallatibacter riparius]